MYEMLSGTEASTVKEVIMICFHSDLLYTELPAVVHVCNSRYVAIQKKKKIAKTKLICREVSLTERLKGHCLPLCGQDELCGGSTCRNGAMKIP